MSRRTVMHDQVDVHHPHPELNMHMLHDATVLHGSTQEALVTSQPAEQEPPAKVPEAPPGRHLDESAAPQRADESRQ